jgi:hypothetical protein
MELSLNLLWLLLAIASFALVGRVGGDRSLRCWHSGRRILALTCALVIFFPVISLTDDLHAAQVVMEDSKPAKRSLKSSGAPSAAASLDGSSPPFTLAAAGLQGGRSLRLLGSTAALETPFWVAVPGERPNPRAPPMPVSA